MEQARFTRRRWFRFSLRTMLILLTVSCIYLGWAANWRMQRDKILNTPRILDGPPTRVWVHKAGPAPLTLRAVGAKGVERLHLRGEFTEEEMNELQELFPEARIELLPSPASLESHEMP